jgi:hypothetical protein
MRHSTTLVTLVLLAGIVAAGCGGSDNTPTAPTEPTPVLTTETFSGTITVNGAQTHPFAVSRAGTVSAQIKTLSDETVVIGISLGTWNGAACQIVIANDAAVLGNAVTGTAQSTGQFCVRLYDVGRLTAGVNYSVEVSHY